MSASARDPEVPRNGRQRTHWNTDRSSISVTRHMAGDGGGMGIGIGVGSGSGLGSGLASGSASATRLGRCQVRRGQRPRSASAIMNCQCPSNRNRDDDYMPMPMLTVSKSVIRDHPRVPGIGPTMTTCRSRSRSRRLHRTRVAYRCCCVHVTHSVQLGGADGVGAANKESHGLSTKLQLYLKHDGRNQRY